MPIQYQIQYRSGFHIWHRINALPAMPQHMHRNVEIIYIRKGHTTCTVDLLTYELHEGDLLFVFADQLHSYGIPSEENDNFALLFPPDIPEYAEFFSAMLPVCPVVRGAVTQELDALFTAAYTACTDKTIPFSAGRKQGYISILLSHLLPLLSVQEKSLLQNNAEYRLVRYCTEHYNEPITLASVAETFSYSAAHLSRIFHNRFRIRFTDFINTLRIEEAKTRLRKDESVTEIAYACGFSSIRNFNRVFKETVGIPPSAYRKQKK